MWKKITAALLVACMLFGAPTPVSLASNANPDISKVETIDTETAVGTLDNTAPETTDVKIPETTEAQKESTDGEDKSEANLNTAPADESNAEPSVDGSEENASATVTDKENAQASDAAGAITPGEDSTAKDGQNVPEEQVPDSNANEQAVVNENEPVVDEVERNDTTDETSFAKLTVEEQYAYIVGLGSEEEVNAALAELSEDELEALEEYAVSQQPENTEIPETIVFTDAGPFMPPVSVAGAAKIRRAAPKEGEDNNDGLILNKKVGKEGNGYKIRLEAYTTGTVTTTTSTKPVDIVLVLDQSGSMAYNFAGNSTNTNSDRRQYAMKAAVNNFIDSVHENYSESSDHRIALVTFGTAASTLQDWTYVNDAGAGTLKGKINGLPNTPSGATNAGAGMSEAETLMGTEYNYTGENKERQKVVIVFTDGVPTTGTDFSTSVADIAISAAKRLKDSGVTVYSIGIFNGANPDQLYGSEGFSRNSNGTAGSDWSDFSFWNIGDIKSYDVPAGNRFLNYLSSNFSGATEIGIENFSRKFLGIGYTGWKITKNYDRTAEGYYLTADNSESLNEIFTKISNNIQTGNIDLESETKINDIVTPYFNMPTNPSQIKVMTADYDGSKFGDDQSSDLAATIDLENNTVSVTGFDFNSNFISENAKDDGTHGKKLIIEFTVTPKESFLGGNEVPTNGEKSGVYDKDGTSVKNFEQPTVDVPIKEVTVAVPDKNVYLLADVSSDDLKGGATITAGGVTIDPSKVNYGLESWQNAFVDIAVTTNPEAGYTGLAEDKEYIVSCNISPKNAGTEQGQSGSKKGQINVFKPEITFRDSDVYYGDIAPENYDVNFVKTVWKHEDSSDDQVEMTGTKPELTFVHTPAASAFVDGKIAAKDDISVNVTTKIGDTDVTGNAIYAHQDCNPSCGFNSNKEEFLLHVKTCDLTIKKTGGESGENFVFNVKKDGTAYVTVVVPANGTVTIGELPVGNYIIAEDTSWAWRYEATYDGNNVNLSSGKPSGTITCTNKSTNDKWLTWTGTIKNEYGKAHQEGGNN